MTTNDQRLDIPALVAALTLDEKVALLDGADLWYTKAVERLGIPSVMLTDGPHGLRKQASDPTRLGLNHSVPATCFPPAAGMASSWDRDLLDRVGAAVGRECRAEGVAVLLGPGVNIKRSPLCGRNFEYFSEDPTLAGELGAALTSGVQSQGVGTSVKHFAANNQETDRMTVSADIDARTLREIYLPAFERVVTTARPWTVMSSYNKINGTYVGECGWLLTGILRDEWGFDGVVVSDWGAVTRRDVCLAAGLDLEMPTSAGTGAGVLVDAVRAGTLREAVIDVAVTRLLTLVDRTLPGLRAPREPFDVAAHHALAREVAAASAVLLKNENGILPLEPEGGPVAVIGAFARDPRYQGAGSSQVFPTRLDNALAALRAGLGDRREVTFAPGFEIESDTADPELVEEAVRTAAAADVVVLFLGLPPSYESEGFDRDHMDLPGHQIDLLNAVADVNPRVVVVLSNGSVVTVTPWQDRAWAVLEGWLLGQAGGSATADLLLGAVSPAGRLAETIPVRYEDNPTIGAFPGEHGHVRYGEGLLVGYRWYDAHRLPVAYPFGHGLSYTTFAYSDLTVAIRADGEEPEVEVTFTVTNTGDRAGREVAQLYVTDPEATVYRPEQELRDFARVALAPGESTVVTFTLGHRAFAFWHEVLGRWVVEGGTFGLRVGASSRDIRLVATVELAGQDIALPLTADSTAAEWLTHPVAGGWVRERLSGTQFGEMLTDDKFSQIITGMPMRRLCRFPGFPISERDVEAAAGRFLA